MRERKPRSGTQGQVSTPATATPSTPTPSGSHRVPARNIATDGRTPIGTRTPRDSSGLGWMRTDGHRGRSHHPDRGSSGSPEETWVHGDAQCMLYSLYVPKDGRPSSLPFGIPHGLSRPVSNPRPARTPGRRADHMPNSIDGFVLSCPSLNLGNAFNERVSATVKSCGPMRLSRNRNPSPTVQLRRSR